MSERRGGGALQQFLRGSRRPLPEDAPGHIIWGFLRGARGNEPSRPPKAARTTEARHAWRHPELQVRPVAIDTTKDPRYRRERSGGYGSTAPYEWDGVRRSPRACRPIRGQVRTSSEFRRLRRMGFELRQSRGEILAVPVDLELVELIGSKPIAIGRSID